MCLEILACPLVCVGHQFFETSWSKGMHARLIVTLNWLHTWVWGWGWVYALWGTCNLLRVYWDPKLDNQINGWIGVSVCYSHEKYAQICALIISVCWTCFAVLAPGLISSVLNNKNVPIFMSFPLIFGQRGICNCSLNLQHAVESTINVLTFSHFKMS